MDSPFVVEKERVKKTREERERERGLFIERGRKPECAADKELAKSEGEREVEFLIRAKWGRCGRKGERERCVLGLFSSLKGKKIVLGGRDDEDVYMDGGGRVRVTTEHGDDHANRW